MTLDSIEDELDVIRLGLYEETKGMSTSEVTAYIKSQLALSQGGRDTSRTTVSFEVV
jgi:hypothetical protein